jgi:hypothetical protein
MLCSRRHCAAIFAIASCSLAATPAPPVLQNAVNALCGPFASMAKEAFEIPDIF